MYRKGEASSQPFLLPDRVRLPDDAALAAAIAFWLIVIFAQHYGTTAHGARYKDYHVPESAGIAAAMLHPKNRR